MSRGSGNTAAVLLVVLGGLTLAGAATAPWVEQVVTRTIADAEVTETVTTRGVEVVRVALPVGIALAAAGILLIALGPRARRILALLVAVAGVIGAADVAAGFLAAGDIEGTMTPGPGAAAVGAVAAIAGGLLAVRSPRRPELGPRFDIDTDADEDDEWRAAVEPEEGDP